MPVDAMAIADDKQVKTLLAAHVRCQCVRILVDFVGVTWLVSTGSREGKLRDRVETLVTLSLRRLILLRVARLLWLLVTTFWSLIVA